MTLLHDYFDTRSLQAFQRLLDGNAGHTQSSSSSLSGSSYGGRSDSQSGGLTYLRCDVNARDWLGRTALHLACASVDNIEYVRALLRHPQIDVNCPDTESLWTPLHRALYSANMPAVLLLLQRADIDPSLKDLEGYTAFDLYNSTLNGTKPHPGKEEGELFTWGTNRNAGLGVGDGNDRMFPELITVKPKYDLATLAKMDLSTRLMSIPVRQIQMSKLHTVIVTAEGEGNLRLCGFGNGGRLGHVQYTQVILKPLPSFKLSIQSVALAQDHTLVVTTAGELYSWGLNRFSQLGYVVEVLKGPNRPEEPMQLAPKKIVGLLKKECVRGVAASRNASACWTKDTVFTWGTNTGQLGYDKVAHPVQVQPRPVTKFKNMVIDIALSENVLAALLVTRQVECIWSDRHVRINFPMHSFPTTIQPYRPPQSVKGAHIIKITNCDDNFAALSSNGEVFTFSASTAAPNLDTYSSEGRTVGPVFKPQKAWALRRKFSAVKDVALGSDGDMIVCTESGHVYVRRRNATSAFNKGFKYDRIPFPQRVTRVCANSTGSFAALRVDHEPKPIVPVGNTLAQDLKMVQPYMQFYCPGSVSGPSRRRSHEVSVPAVDDEPEDLSIESDIEGILDLLQVLSVELSLRRAGGGHIKCDRIRFPHDADTLVHLEMGPVFPVHRVILAARSPVLETLIVDHQPLVDTQSDLSLKLMPSKPGPGLGVPKLTCLLISGCHALTVLILLRFFYSDELLAIWDRRVSSAVYEKLASIGVDSTRIKLELQSFARLLNLTVLSQGLEHPVKQASVQTMAQDMWRLFNVAQSPLLRDSPLAHNVVLQLADKDVYTHSVVLRARTSLLASFFDLEDWTVKRWNSDGTIRLNMEHISWHVMRYVLEFLCCGANEGMFDVLEFVSSIDDLLRFMFDVTAVASELFLDHLILLSASRILVHCNLQNACYILEDATYYHIQPLVERVQEYIAINLDAFLEGHLLDQLPYSLVKQLARFVKGRQIEKSPFSRSDDFTKEMLNKHAAWLERQDIPGTIVKTITSRPSKTHGLKLPLSPKKEVSFTSPVKPSIRRFPSGDEIFDMDEQESGPPILVSKPIAIVSSPPLVWKPTSIPRVDMKTVMAETEAASKSQMLVPARSPGKPFLRSDSAGPWKFDPGATVTHLTAVGTLATPSPPIRNIATASPMRSEHAEPAQAKLGPVITPKRQMQPKSGLPRTAWTTLPVQPGLKCSSTTGLSFSAIQDSQKQPVTPVKDVQSLKKIQEEEQSLQLETDFLKWWTAEEERIRQEEVTLALAQQKSLSAEPCKAFMKVRRQTGKQKDKGSGSQSKLI